MRIPLSVQSIIGATDRRAASDNEVWPEVMSRSGLRVGEALSSIRLRDGQM